MDTNNDITFKVWVAFHNYVKCYTLNEFEHKCGLFHHVGNYIETFAFMHLLSKMYCLSSLQERREESYGRSLTYCECMNTVYRDV